MEIVVTITTMAIIGAIIGAFTNHIAIKMLFRPYEAKYIGKWRVPFTPGLIPKRRDELATQLGKLVIHYLLTPELIEKRYLSEDVKNRIHKTVERQIKDHLGLDRVSIRTWLERAEFNDVEQKVTRLIDSQIDQQALKMKATLETGTLAELMPEEWRMKVEAKIPELTDLILIRGKEFVQSEDGKRTLKQLVDDFLASKGTFGNMILMMVGDSHSLANKLQPEITKFMDAPGTHQLITNLIQGEWNKIKGRPLSDLLEGFDVDPIITQVKSYVHEQVAIESQLDEPITKLFPSAPAVLTQTLVPKTLDFVFSRMHSELPKLFDKLKLDQVVKEQVNTFPVSRLEELVLGLSRREFKMITILGGVLGGLIGIVQGIIALIVNS